MAESSDVESNLPAWECHPTHQLLHDVTTSDLLQSSGDELSSSLSSDSGSDVDDDDDHDHDHTYDDLNIPQSKHDDQAGYPRASVLFKIVNIWRKSPGSLSPSEKRMVVDWYVSSSSFFFFF